MRLVEDRISGHEHHAANLMSSARSATLRPSNVFGRWLTVQLPRLDYLC